MTDALLIYATCAAVAALRAQYLNSRFGGMFPTSVIILFAVAWPWWAFLSIVKYFRL